MGPEEVKSRIFELIREYHQLKFADKRPGRVPISGKIFDEKELISATDAVLDGWWTEGKITKEFERKFNEFLGVKNTIVVNSGSSANLLAMMTLTSKKLGQRRVKKGDEVITVAAGFPTTINPIIQAGCVPVLCDVDIGTYGINIGQFKEAISPKTKAVFLAHTLGNPFNLDEVTKVCNEHNLWLIEDNCDSLGSRYHDRYTGTFGDLCTISFYPAHHITMGEGGVVCTNSALLGKIARSIRDWGRDCWCPTGVDNTCGKRFAWKLGDLPSGYDHKYIYSEIGYNLKNTDLNVAIGLAQMEKLQGFIVARKRNFKLLYEGLKQFEKYLILPQAEEHSDPSWFGFLITIREDGPFSRTDLIKHLEDKGIATRLLFCGNVIKQPYFIDNEIPHRVVGSLKNTDLIMTNTFWVGVYPGITEVMVKQMVAAFESFMKAQE